MRIRIEIRKERPLAITKAELQMLFGAWPKEVDRMLAATRAGNPWLEFVSNQQGTPGLITRVTTESAEIAFERIRAGERPPLMPSERKLKKRLASTPAPTERAIDEAIDHLLDLFRVLPSRISHVTINRESHSVSLQLTDGSYRVSRLAKTKPGKKRRILSVTFVQNPLPQISKQTSK